MFGAYAGRNVMTMGRQDRSNWIAEKFEHREDDENMVTMPTLFAGDVVFFHSAHIHRGPANSCRRGKRRPKQVNLGGPFSLVSILIRRRVKLMWSQQRIVGTS